MADKEENTQEPKESLINPMVLKSLLVDTISEAFAESVSKAVADYKLSNKNRDLMVAGIKESFTQDKLVIVLGAGVSIPYALPSWNTLMQALISKTLFNNSKDETENDDRKALVFAEVFNAVFSPNPLISARFLSSKYEIKNAEFEKEVKKILYQDISLKDTSSLMKELVQLCAAPGKSPNLDSIITYNFDDILEYELDRSSVKIPFTSIYASPHEIKKNELPIYHVHGFIPRDRDIQLNNRITLGEEIYHKQYSEVYNWQNLIQLEKFKDKTCLFIGVSLTDPNQRRLLDISKGLRPENSPHYIIKKKYDLNTVKEKLDAFVQSNPGILERKNINDISLENLSEVMIASAEKFENDDAQSLGLHVIWIESYEEIPSILESIRS